MHKGEWHHFAVTWCPAAWRFYVDGVLAGMTTTPPLKWADALSAVTVGSPYDHSGWDGVIDEIRISKVERFGPVLPKGATPSPLPVPEEPAAAPAPPKPKDFGPDRAKLLGTLPATQAGAFESTPDADGEYVYEATSAKPMVEGIPFKLQPDSPIKGLTTAVVERPVLLGLPNLDGMYWRLAGVKSGRYWVGLWYRCGADNQGVEVPSNGIGQQDLYLNGRELQCTTLGDPVQVAPGAWFCQMQSAAMENLKEGDEITVVGNCGARVEALRLVLMPKEPARGPNRTRINPGPNTWNQDTALGLTVESSFVAAQGKPLYGACGTASLPPSRRWNPPTISPATRTATRWPIAAWPTRCR